ncbi:MAG: hypothetical protein U0164_02880 [Gemmatimonadaceae bacterium]
MIIIPPQTTAHATARSRALADRLRATIAEFQVREPKVTKEEIAQALHDVQLPSGGRAANKRAAVLATVAGTTVAIGIGLLASSAEKAGRQPSPVVVISLVVVLLSAIAAVAIKARRDD